MKKGRFLWSAHRITEKQKAGKARNIKEKQLKNSRKEDIDPQEFIEYCLEPAKEMRAVIKKQLCIIDPKEFNVPGKNAIPDIQYNY